MTLTLSDQAPFAQGGNRLCFVHPEDAGRCVKVRRPDFSLAQLRRSKGFPKNLRPLSSFDDNREEWRVIQQIRQQLGDGAFEHIYRCYGFVETDLGDGLVCELIRDPTGPISLSLKQYLWEFGLTDSCQAALDRFRAFWLEHRVPSRNLIPHNLVVQQAADGTVRRLVAIDGLGSPNLVPWHWLPAGAQRAKVADRLAHLDGKIRDALDKRARGIAPSAMGMLKHRDMAPADDAQHD